MAEVGVAGRVIILHADMQGLTTDGSWPREGFRPEAGMTAPGHSATGQSGTGQTATGRFAAGSFDDLFDDL